MGPRATPGASGGTPGGPWGPCACRLEPDPSTFVTRSVAILAHAISSMCEPVRSSPKLIARAVGTAAMCSTSSEGPPCAGSTSSTRTGASSRAKKRTLRYRRQFERLAAQCDVVDDGGAEYVFLRVPRAIAGRLQDVACSMAVHANDCVRLGENVHFPSAAAAKLKADERARAPKALSLNRTRTLTPTKSSPVTRTRYSTTH